MTQASKHLLILTPAICRGRPIVECRVDFLLPGAEAKEQWQAILGLVEERDIAVYFSPVHSFSIHLFRHIKCELLHEYVGCLHFPVLDVVRQFRRYDIPDRKVPAYLLRQFCQFLNV